MDTILTYAHLQCLSTALLFFALGLYVCLHIYAPLCLCVCANMNNTSKMLLTPRHGASFVAAAASAAMSDRHDISSFRYMQLCIGLLHTV